MRDTATIQIQPLQLTIHNGSAMMVCDREGWVHDGRTGLFDHDTRYLSTYEMSFEEFNPRFLTAQRLAYNALVLNYTNSSFHPGLVAVPPDSLFMKITRILDERLHESIEVSSFVKHPVSFRLMVNLECPFETVFEVRGLCRVPPRVTHLRYDAGNRTVIATYRDEWFSRQFTYHVAGADSEPWYSPNLLIFTVQLQHHQTWHAETSATMTGSIRGPLSRPIASGHGSAAAASTGQSLPRVRVAERLTQARAGAECWTSQLTNISTSNQVVQRALDQSIRDLTSLRLEKVGDEWYPAAGVPWYNCVFGRDALIATIQCLPLGYPFPHAVLTRLAELQGTRVNPWNDEEPGKIPHELRVGQLSLMGKIPFDPFYGTVDASLYYVVLLSETYRFTGDRQLLEIFIGVVDGCLRWAAEYGDVDGDGFIDYWMRSPHDYHNQAWKDSDDAVVYPDGSIVPDPIAIVEVQGIYFDTLRRAAEIYRILGKPDHAEAAEERAARLYREFNDRFWMPEEGFYAFGLDPHKRPIHSITSNPGQLLWTGIVPPDRARRVAERLMAKDMSCGWGIRTLSSLNGAYDPVAYQRGSVWPFDNAIIARGLKKYGHWKEANRIAEGIFAASGYFAHGQLPELWAGLDRDETEWPIIYPDANVPQAWSAGSVPMLLQAILGIEPDIGRRRLILRPTLPDWLEQVTIRGLRFAKGSVDLKFSGQGTSTRVEILGISGGIEIECQSVSTGAS